MHLLALLLLLPALVSASALTTAINPNERLCFYADVDKAGEKIGVRRPLTPIPPTPPLIPVPSSTLQSSPVGHSTSTLR